MPKRNGLQTISSPHIQGEDSWVKIKPVTVAQYNRRQRLLNQINQAARAGDQATVDRGTAEITDLMSAVVVAWNWVDDEGMPIAQPHNNPGVFEFLTMDEISFIQELVDPYAALQKKAAMMSSATLSST